MYQQITARFQTQFNYDLLCCAVGICTTLRPYHQSSLLLVYVTDSRDAINGIIYSQEVIACRWRKGGEKWLRLNERRLLFPGNTLLMFCPRVCRRACYKLCETKETKISLTQSRWFPVIYILRHINVQAVEETNRMYMYLHLTRHIWYPWRSDLITLLIFRSNTPCFGLMWGSCMVDSIFRYVLWAKCEVAFDFMPRFSPCTYNVFVSLQAYYKKAKLLGKQLICKKKM